MLKQQSAAAITLPSTAWIEPRLEAFKKIAEIVCAKYRWLIITIVKELPLGEHVYQWQLEARTNETTGKYLPKVANIRKTIVCAASDQGLQSLTVTVQAWQNKLIMGFSDIARELTEIQENLSRTRKRKPILAEDNVPPAISPATETTE